MVSQIVCAFVILIVIAKWQWRDSINLYSHLLKRDFPMPCQQGVMLNLNFCQSDRKFISQSGSICIFELWVTLIIYYYIQHQVVFFPLVNSLFVFLAYFSVAFNFSPLSVKIKCLFWNTYRKVVKNFFLFLCRY